MKCCLLLLLLAPLPMQAKKLTVKIIDHKMRSREWSANSPGVAVSNGNTTANIYGNASGASGYGTASGTTIAVPPSTMNGVVYDFQLLLLLPDGRQVLAVCNSRPHDAWSRGHQCKNPTTDTAEADFSGSRVKLKWSAGIDEKKKETENYLIVEVKPAAK